MPIIRLFLFLFLFNDLLAQDKKVLMLFERGKQEYAAKKFESSQQFFLKYLEKDTSKVEAYYRLGLIAELFRNTEKAKFYYAKTIQKDTTKSLYVSAYTFLGARALEKNQFATAKQYLEVSSKYTNKNSIAYAQVMKQLRTADFGILSLANPVDIKPEPLPSMVNFKKMQYFPVLTADNQTLIFTARNENEDENIYTAELQNGTWLQPKSISGEINSPSNEGTCSISADGKIMVFTSCEGRQSFGSCDLYISRKENQSWSTPLNLGPLVNSPFWDSQPSLSSDGSKLYFSSERPFGVGKKDLWMSEIDENGKWKKAINLGKSINTTEDEVSPFIHANGLSLFFSSKGKEGMGSLDIFMNQIGTSECINLGYPINTAADEISLFITADGQKAYYSVDENNSVKLYSFTIPEILAKKINRTYYIKGYVLDDQTTQPLYATLELIDSRSGAKLSKFQSDPITGDYMAVLPGTGTYVLYIETPQHFFKSFKFDFDKESKNQIIDFKLSKIEKLKKETLQNIFFDSGSAVLRSESDIELLKLKNLLTQNKTLKVEISGHTDDIGNDQSNLELSKKRASSVVKNLKDAGIEESRILAQGYGETQPKVKNTTELNRQQNRRIEIKFL